MLTDHRTCARNEKQKVKEKIEEILRDVKLLPIAIGRHVNLKELQKINNCREVPMFGEYEDPAKVGTKIIQGAFMQQPELQLKLTIQTVSVIQTRT